MDSVARRRASYFFITLAGVLLIFCADYLGFFEGINTYIYDLSFRIRGQNKPSEKIIIAAIDEKTLDKVGRWPVRRIYYAILLDRIRQAQVVGFDVIMSEASDDDAVLAQAIKQHSRVILPVYIDRTLNIVTPLNSLSPYRTGHMHIEQGVDNVARQIFHTLYLKNEQIPSLTSVVYETLTGKAFNRQKKQEEVQGKTNSKSIFQMDSMNINYYGTPGTFLQIPVIDIIDGRYQPSFFAGKAVLVGMTAPGMVDMILTPFSQHRNRMPGVEVHANILNNLIDNNPIKDVDVWLEWLSAIALSVLFFLLFMKLSEKRATVLWMLGILITTTLAILLFSVFNLWLRPAIYFFSLSFIFIITYIFRLDEAARKLDMKYSSISSLLGGRMEEPPKLIIPNGLPGFLSTGGINTKIQKLLWAEHQYEKKLEYTIQEKTQELSNALQTISGMSNEMIFRLTAAAESKDEYTGKHISRIGLYANKLSEALEMPSDFIERITLASAMHDIGKIGIPNKILLKPGELSPEENEIIKTHTTIGAKILSGSAFPMIQMSATIALYHHERWNGTGYPKGLRGGDIPVEARILMICDIYDALRSRRPYKMSFDHKKAFVIITEGDVKTRPDHYDPDVLHAFIKISSVFDEIFSRYSD